VTSDPPFLSAALDSDVHDLSTFNSGEARFDTWLRAYAASAVRARVAQTFVWSDVGGDRVVAYYAISAHAVPRIEAPTSIGRGVPDPVPAALIAKLALDQSLHGRGLGSVLLADALDRIIAASAIGPAVRAIVVDASTERGRALYSRFGFVDAPGRSGRMIVRAGTVAKGLGRR
jgi:GNAT superfamily N-acetyltransferase